MALNNSPSVDVDDRWMEAECRCGIGDRHFKFIRADMAMVSLDHGKCGTMLSSRIYATGPELGDEINGCKTFSGAMSAIDKKWPL